MPLAALICLVACGTPAGQQPAPAPSSAADTTTVDGAAAEGPFHWIPWAEVTADVKNELKTYRYAKAAGNVGDDTQADFDGGCTDINVARHDFDGDGWPGIIITKFCSDYCGSAGCSFEVYEDHGRTSIHLTDQIDMVVPARNGVNTSSGRFMPLTPR